MFTSMLRWFNDQAVRDERTARYRSRGRTVSPQQRFMRFEALEDRSLLSTFTVLNLADSGNGSLRAAILAADVNPGPDVIRFAQNVQGTIALSTGELLIDSDLTIKGPGANRVTVSGNDASRVLHVLGGAGLTTTINVSISDLKVTHGIAVEGAGINHEGFANLTLVGMNISNNHASASGGGIFSLGEGAKLALGNSIITENRVIGGGADLINGGGIGIHYGAIAEIDRTTITGNRVVGSPNGRNGGGGGIESDFGSTLTITNSTISNNRVFAPAGGDAHGGAIVSAFGSTLNITKSTISGNEVRGGDGTAGIAVGEATGGAIDSSFGSVLHVSASIITGNRAIGGNGNLGQALGGGIESGFGSSAYISDSLLSNNSAIAGNRGSDDGNDFSVSTAFGGGISSIVSSYLEVTNSVLQGNQAIGGNNATHIAPTTADVGVAHGGAILVGFGGEAIIRDSAILNNKAIGGSGNTGSGPVGFVGTATGGGIDNSGDPAIFGEPSAPPKLTVTNTTLVGNAALGGNNNTGSGAQVFVSAGLGGGIANYLGGITDISTSLLSGNKATGGKGGLGAGGGIFNGISVIQLDTGPVAVPSIVNVTKSILALNVAQGGAGTPGGNGFGGGAYNDKDSTLTLQKSTVTENRANGAQSGGQGIGGGIYNLGTFDFDTFTVIRKNRASTSHDNIFG